MTDEPISALALRLTWPDVVDLPDWAAADVLNQPDEQQPVVVTWARTEVGVGTILDVLGPSAGANLLDVLKNASDPVLRWGMHILERGMLDISLGSTQVQLQALTQAGVLTEDQRTVLLALSRQERHPSWAEANGINVNARAVGLARGGKP